MKTGRQIINLRALRFGYQFLVLPTARVATAVLCTLALLCALVLTRRPLSLAHTLRAGASNNRLLLSLLALSPPAVGLCAAHRRTSRQRCSQPPPPSQPSLVAQRPQAGEARETSRIPLGAAMNSYSVSLLIATGQRNPMGLATGALVAAAGSNRHWLASRLDHRARALP